MKNFLSNEEEEEEETWIRGNLENSCSGRVGHNRQFVVKFVSYILSNADGGGSSSSGNDHLLLQQVVAARGILFRWSIFSLHEIRVYQVLRKAKLLFKK